MKLFLGVNALFILSTLCFAKLIEKQEDEVLVLIASREREAIIAGLKEVLARRASFFEEEKNLSDNERSRRATDIAERFETLVRRFPESVPAVYFYAEFLRDGGENKAAEKLLLSAEKKDPDFAPVQFLLAELFAARGAVEDAFSRFVSSVYLDPGNAHFHGVFGEFLCESREKLLEKKIFSSRGKLDERMQSEFLEACATDFENIDSFWRYAESFYDVENADWSKALNAWDRVIQKIAPEKESVQGPAASLHRSRVLAELGRIEDAELLLRETTSVPALERSRQKVFEIIKNKKARTSR